MSDVAAAAKESARNAVNELSAYAQGREPGPEQPCPVKSLKETLESLLEAYEKTKNLILDTQRQAQMDMLRLMYPAMAAAQAQPPTPPAEPTTPA